MQQMLCYCDFSVHGQIYEAWALYRIPVANETEIIDAQCDMLRIITGRLKAKGFVIGMEVWFVFRVLTANDVEWPNILAHVPRIADNERWSMRIHKREG